MRRRIKLGLAGMVVMMLLSTSRRFPATRYGNRPVNIWYRITPSA